MASEPRAELHPDLAGKYGIVTGDEIELRTRRGRAVFRAQVTDAIRPDTVFTPFHWGGAASANALTNPALDPHSKMPAFKVCAVAIGVPAAPATKGADMHSSPRFLQGVFAFEGKGIDQPIPLDPALTYTVPDGVTAQAVYFRGGNTTAELVCVVLMRDGAPMRYFPIGAKADVHVPLRVVEDLESGTAVELHLAAPAGVAGAVIVDVGFVEV